MLRKHPFLTVLLISLAGLLTAARNDDAPASALPQHVFRQALLTGQGQDSLSSFGQLIPVCRCFSNLDNGSHSGNTAHDEMRHRKTLVSQAIVADFSLPRQSFTYCTRKYSLFLPERCSNCPLHHSSFRGPPFCC